MLFPFFFVGFEKCHRKVIFVLKISIASLLNNTTVTLKAIGVNKNQYDYAAKGKAMKIAPEIC